MLSVVDGGVWVLMYPPVDGRSEHAVCDFREWDEDDVVRRRALHGVGHPAPTLR